MAMSFSGAAVLNGITSSFSNGRAKLNGVNTVKFGRKTESVVVSQRKKSLIYAVKDDGNIIDGINDATKKATEFVTEKTQEALKDAEKAKDYIVEKSVEAKDVAVEKGKEAAEFLESKAGEVKEEATKS
ncbi:unnamed protein product [Cochlearia groenlandica]